jgi:hypothetical protein
VSPGFIREQQLLDLAIKLQTGSTTPEEQQDAASALSYTAGARLGFEYRANALEKRLNFMTTVLNLYSEYDLQDHLWFRRDERGSAVFMAKCSDTFWAQADVETITPENLSLLQGAFEDVATIVAPLYSDIRLAPILFVARIRGARPMPGFAIPDSLKGLFDACGPERNQ